MTIRTLLRVSLIAAPLAFVTLLPAAEPPATQPAATEQKVGKTETTPSGLQITHVAPGTGAQDGDTVYVLYTGKLQDGTVFDSTSQRGDEPIEFVLGRKMVIEGWDEGIKGMLVGEDSVGCLRWGSALGASSVRSVSATESVFKREEAVEFMAQHELALG